MAAKLTAADPYSKTPAMNDAFASREGADDGYYVLDPVGKEKHQGVQKSKHSQAGWDVPSQWQLIKEKKTMLRRSFLFRLAGVLGSLASLSVERVVADDSVPCPDCGSPSRPRRWCEGATEYACFECGKDLPLGAFMFTRKTNDPNYYWFFPADIERMFSGSNFESAEIERC